MAPVPKDVSPPPPPPTPTRNSRRSHHHKTLASLLSKVFSPSSSNSRPEKQSSGGSKPEHANSSANAETESDSAYRDLGIDPDRLTVFNVARDCGRSKTKSTTLFSNLAAASTSANLQISSSLPGCDVIGGDGGDGDNGGRWEDVPPPPPPPPLPQGTTRLPPSSSLDHHYPPRRSWRWMNSKRSHHQPQPQLPHTPAPPFSPSVEDLVDDRNNNTSGKTEAAGEINSSKNRNKVRERWKGKGKMSSSERTTSPLQMIEPTSSSPQPPTPPPKPNQPPKPRTVSEVLQARERVRLERRSLKASGDWLGVQGADPWTGEVAVLTPTNTVSSSSGGSGILLGNKPGNNSSVANNGSDNGAPFDVRGLLGSIIGRRRAAERACDRDREMEVRSREKVRESRDRAKLEKIERRKVEEGWRIKRESMLGADGCKGGGSGTSGVGGFGTSAQQQPMPRRWRQHRDQWSSIVEPNLSPIAQSVSSSPTNVDEPLSSSALSKAMPNYSWPIKSPEVPEVPQDGRTTITPKGHKRSQSTDTIIHNGKNKMSGYEPYHPAGETPSIVRNISLPERIQDSGPSNQTRQEGKHFLWRRRRRMTDPGGHGSRSPVAEIITTPTKASTPQTQEAKRCPPANHFTGLVIPDYHLHFLTPEPGERPGTPLSRTGDATTPLPLRTLESGKGKAVEHKVQINNNDHHPANEATATSYQSKSKGLMKRHSVHRRVIPIKSSADCLLANGKSKKTSVHIPLTHSRSLDTHWSYKVEQQRLKRNGLDPKDGTNNRSRIDDTQEALTDPPPNTTNVVEVEHMGAMNHRHGDELPLQELEDVSEESSRRSSPLGPSATTGGRRFAFIPTTTTTGSARNRGHSPPEEGRERERKVPTPPPWALRAFRTPSDDDDLATRGSSSPSPPSRLPPATLTTSTTMATTTAPTKESAHTTDEAPMTSSPGLRRSSRLIPPRRCSLSSAGPGASETETETELKVEKRKERGIGTTYSPFPPSTRPATNTNGASEVVTRSVSLPARKKKPVVHFSEEELARGKMEKEKFDREKRAHTEPEPEPELETVVARNLTFHMVSPPPPGASRGVQCLPEGRGQENNTMGITNAYGEGKGKKSQAITKTKIIPLSPESDPKAVVTMGAFVNGTATTPMSIHMARLPARTQLLSEHMEEMVREAARSAAAKTRRCADMNQRTTAAVEESLNGGESLTGSRGTDSKPEAMTSVVPDGDDIQRIDCAHAHDQKCGGMIAKSKNPVLTIRKEDVNQGSCPKESEGNGNSNGAAEGEAGVKEETEELQHLKRELLKRVEEDIQKQKRERLALPLPPPPAPTCPLPLPPPDQQQVQQQQQKQLILPRHQQDAGGLLLMGLMSQDNDKYHTLPRPPRPSQPPHHHRRFQKDGSSDCTPRATVNPLLPERIVQQQQQEVKSEVQPGPQPQILPPQPQEVQQLPLREGSPKGGAGTDGRSQLQTRRLLRTDNGISSSSSSSSRSSSNRIHPPHARTDAVSAEATAAAITAVRQAQAQTQAQGRDSAQVTTITTTNTAGASTVAKGSSKANKVTRVTYLNDAATTPTMTGTATGTRTENSSKKDSKGYNSSIDPLLTPLMDFVRAMLLLVGVIGTAWFLVACTALDPNSELWKRRRARRGSGSSSTSTIGNESSSACADVAVFVLAGLFCVIVVMLGQYIAVVLGWVGVFW
ncbi:hypothetical protein SLS62_007682 [Diatrype stigma]|uniref:Uncharacterized protein n=1 Tax=Diatrype stigma TaxID=117547 RepID=A0AAN9UYW1_9PEZI